MKSKKVFVWMLIGSAVYIIAAASLLYVTKDLKKNIIRAYIAQEQNVIENLGQNEILRLQLALINAQNQNLDLAVIEKKDQLWMESQEQNLIIQTYLNNEISQILKRIREAHPEFKEIFVTDQYGLIAGLTNRTSDYYQADEGWWINTKTKSSYVGDIEFDESARCWAYPVFYAVRDQTGNFLGVIKAVLDITTAI